MFDKFKIKYLDIIIAVLVSFIGIQLIINYKVILKILGDIINILMPFIVAFVIAYILNPIMKFIEKNLKVNRTIGVLFTYILIIILITIFSMTVIPKVFNSGMDMVNKMPEFAQRMYLWVSGHISSKFVNSGSGSLVRDNAGKWIEKFSSMSSAWLAVALNQIVSTTASLINVIFGLIISIYMLYDKEKFKQNSKNLVYILLGNRSGNKLINVARNVDEMVGTYIGIKAIDSFIIGIICLIGLMLFKCPYVLIISIIVMITNMIPYFGPFMGMIPPFLINVFYDPKKAFGILIFLVLLQQFDAWILEPKLVSDRVGVSPFLVILGITVFGSLFGIIGMLLASPIMAVLNIYVGGWFRRKVKEYNKTQESK
ncbi:Putative transport protein YhhT [Clostridium haemolyticum]|uniref:AI-2E family transporter n=1 Tax=Clostridium haemolyticum TaxID=84025 RepID=UPI001C3C1AA8|nr:AI-2E family transporter [Clostridium haemolyticum]CAG7839793.1 Putative transport protein YhhT [Clostridium haemolyticum]